MQIDRLKRREVIALLGGSMAAWPFPVRAQPVDRERRIGILVGGADNDAETRGSLTGFRQGLERFGWSEGRNIRIDTRFARGSVDQIPALAKELLALQPDVILAHSTPIVAALLRENRTIPMVFVSVSDPVGSGFVTSLARPGGNLTGLLLYEEGIVGKWLAMLKEVAPHTASVAFLANPGVPTYEYFVRTAKAIAPSLAIELVPSPAETTTDLERAIESFARTPNGGLVLTPNNIANVHRHVIIALAARHRLPAVYAFRFFVADGGLMSYGIDQIDMFLRAASYVDRILRGAKPADLPVQAPVKYETALNLKTAKALGLEVPSTLLVRADEVIE